MIKDGLLKAFCLPLMGIAIPMVAQLFCCPQPGIGRMGVTLLYYAVLSVLLWQAAVWAVHRSRNVALAPGAFSTRLLVLCIAGATGGFGISAGATILWQQLVLGGLRWPVVLRTGGLYAIAAVLLVLLYEALLLAKERELDVKIVRQLDQERRQAELTALKSELGPHFMFNSLTSLTHLISVAPDTAQTFTQKLSRVYKYFLINRERELISLSDELRFIEDYVFLLQIRYDNGLQLEVQVGQVPQGAMVVPCSLQLLVENAIKHNSFSETHPLTISIRTEADWVVVENERRSKPYITPGTRIGLSHLHQHYGLISHREVVITETDDRFTVKLPLIKQTGI